MHCCGNTDWAMIMEMNLDVVNFDAFEYAQTVSLYADAAQDFLGRGGVFAWGIVPTTDEIDAADIDGLWTRLNDGMKIFVARGIAQDALRRQCLLTPSCGAGSMSAHRCEKVFDLLFELRKKYRQG